MSPKRVIFFDGDGTLWYPKLTKRTRELHWVYYDVDTKDDYLNHLELTPGAKATLQSLHDEGIYLVVISANPHKEEIAMREIGERIDYFGLSNLIHAYRSSDGDNPMDKGRVMLEVLADLHIHKKDALMVGDSYFYDYIAAQSVGIDALFIENDTTKKPDVLPENMLTIREVEDIVVVAKTL